MKEKGKLLGPGDRFSFDCHKKLSCFGKCCRMRLELTPYDLLRLCRKLGITSGRFLDSYCFIERVPSGGPPAVVLKPDSNGRCVFLRSYGCNVYPDRPGACRNFPLSRAISVEEGISRVYLQNLPDFCRGAVTSKSWSVEEWRAFSGLSEYERWNDAFIRLVSRLERLKIPSSDLSPAWELLYDFDRYLPDACRIKGVSLPSDNDELMEILCGLVEEFISEQEKKHP
ncbi:MAG: YkgJ family cysteine cluster protein [Deltaproteobacteria bacterium]|nr:YkgJ family cysteine cluster protein [Deltaproteobacteria bacterium]